MASSQPYQPPKRLRIASSNTPQSEQQFRNDLPKEMYELFQGQNMCVVERLIGMHVSINFCLDIKSF